jgi:ligand-binding sensor protein
MILTDIQTIQKWIDLEKQIYQKSGIQPSVYNTDGIGITDYKQWANRLCPAIKATADGQTFICAAAHTNMAAMAQKNRKPVIEECDAGLLKIVVPIFAGDQFVGAAGGCGLLPVDGEVDTFMINKTTEIEEKKIQALSTDIGFLSMASARELADFIAGEIHRITAKFEAAHA